MADAGHEFADAAVEAFLAEVAETYRQAEADAARTLRRFLARFEEQDAAKRAEMAEGKLPKADYTAWRKSKMLVGKHHASVLDQVARAYSHANEVAVAALSGRLPEVYAENANFAAFEVCRESGLDLSFDLVDADTVQHMLVSGEAVLPAPSVDVPKDLAWNRRLVASQLTQGVLLGESIPKMAERVHRVTGSNYATAVRTARTAVTGAENAGRVASYRRAQGMGIDVGQEWLATLDGRTRHSHRQLDGERVEAGGTFSNGCRFPGDPLGPSWEIYNCRCTLVPVVEGIDQSDAHRWSRLPEGVTYERWKAGKATAAYDSTGRTVKEFVQQPSVAKSLEKRGMSLSQGQKALSAYMKARGTDGHAFRRMTKAEQRRMWYAAVSEREKHTVSRGRVAYSQKEVDEVIERNGIDVKWPVRPTYNPRLRTPGLTTCIEPLPGLRRIKSIEIGPQRNGEERELLDTILHEALEAKMLLRDDRRLAGGDAEVHPYIDRVIAKYAKMKGLW